MTIIFIGFVIITAFVLLPSQVRKQKESLDEVSTSLSVRMEQLKNDFQFRTKELARRLKSGDLADDEWQKLSDELSLDTESSIESTESATQSSKVNVSWLFAISILIVISSIVTITYKYSGEYEKVSNQMTIVNQLTTDPNTIDKLTNIVQTEQTNAALDNLYLAYRSKVELLPSNTSAWRELAAFNATYRRMDEAKEAMQIAMKLEPDNLDLKIDLAQLLTTSKEKQDLFRSFKLVNEVLRKDPGHENALFLLANSSFQFGLYKKAILTWQKLLTQFESDLDMTLMLNQRISMAEEKIAEKEVNQTSTTSSETKDPKTVVTKASMAVKVEIPDSVRLTLSGNERLFVFAKAVDGPRFPIAVKNMSVEDAAGIIVLSDTDAMRPEFALSKYKKVQLVVRISKSGTAIAGKGDIEGKSEVITAPFPTKPVTIAVNNVIYDATK